MQFKTHIGIYAIITTNNQILLIHKSRGPYAGLLDLPGGRPEFSENFEETFFSFCCIDSEKTY